MKNNFLSDVKTKQQRVKRNSASKRTSSAAMMESLFACKWSARILSLIRHGVTRPGAITRSLDGLTAKVLNDCLRKHVEFGLVKRLAFSEIPPRVEYHLTELGTRVVTIIDAVEALQPEIAAQYENVE